MAKKYLFIFFLSTCFIFCKAQNYHYIDSINSLEPYPFKPGDIIINVNYGWPQITPVILRAALNAYNKYVDNKDYVFTIKNSGVFNAKAEYAINDNLGLGFATSYWSMSAEMQNNYSGNDPNTGIPSTYADNYLLSVSALALGIRGNYHFTDLLKSPKLDPYYGFSIGTTKYTYGLEFTSTYPDKKSPEIYDLFKTGLASKFLKSGWSSYVSTTFGIRWFPIKYVGINLEAGWDRGAFLFGGLAVKFNTKPVKALNN